MVWLLDSRLHGNDKRWPAGLRGVSSPRKRGSRLVGQDPLAGLDEWGPAMPKPLSIIALSRLRSFPYAI